MPAFLKYRYNACAAVVLTAAAAAVAVVVSAAAAACSAGVVVVIAAEGSVLRKEEDDDQNKHPGAAISTEKTVHCCFTSFYLGYNNIICISFMRVTETYCPSAKKDEIVFNFYLTTVIYISKIEASPARNKKLQEE